MRRLPRSGVRYLVSGNTGPSLLILNGGTLVAETAEPLVTLFEGRFRTLTPWHPPLPTMTARVEVLLELLDREGIEQVAVLGQSFGGTLAQAMIAEAPERIAKVVLSATGSPFLPDAAKAVLQQMAGQLAATSDAALIAATKAQFSGFLPQAPEAKRFWDAVLDDLFDHVLSPTDVRAFYAASADFFTTYPDKAQAFAAWKGEALILRAEDDPALAMVDSPRLDSMFSRAHVHRFATGGHMLSVTQRESYGEVVSGFLLGG